MQQPEFKELKPSLIIFLFVFAFSSLGFAFLGLVWGPKTSLELESPRQRVEEIKRPAIPDLEPLEDFWQEQGYYLLEQTRSSELQKTDQLWLQGQETWLLIPGEPDFDVATDVLTLWHGFLEAGWLVQMEVHENMFSFSFWSELSSSNERVLAYQWEIELLNPHNYGEKYLGQIPVMGELFATEAFILGTPQAPLLTLIIDDWGYSTSAIEPMLAYPFPLTMAILPHLVRSKEVSERAFAKGHEVILHQPMEALSSDLNLGPGAITVGMDSDELKQTLKENILSLPEIIGLNNHMGSKATEDWDTMREILEVVQELGLFFVDSRTSNASVAQDVAADVGIQFSSNHLFIDNENEVDKIKEQLWQALALAEKKGHAVAIGHVRPNTAIALWEMIPEFLASNVRLVPVSYSLQDLSKIRLD